MEAHFNVSHQLRSLLPDLVNKRTNTNTCNKPSTSFYRKYVVHQMIFSTYFIVLNPFMHNVVKWPNVMHERVKLTYDMKDLTYFLTCEVKYNAILFVG